MIPEFPGDVRLCLSVLSASIHRKMETIYSEFRTSLYTGCGQLFPQFILNLFYVEVGCRTGKNFLKKSQKKF